MPTPNPTNPTPDTAAARQSGNEMVARWMGWRVTLDDLDAGPWFHLRDPSGRYMGGASSSDYLWKRIPDLFDPGPAGASWRESCTERLINAGWYSQEDNRFTDDGRFMVKWYKWNSPLTASALYPTLGEARANAIIAAVRAIEAAQQGQEGG